MVWRPGVGHSASSPHRLSGTAGCRSASDPLVDQGAGRPRPAANAGQVDRSSEPSLAAGAAIRSLDRARRQALDRDVLRVSSGPALIYTLGTRDRPVLTLLREESTIGGRWHQPVPVPARTGGRPPIRVRSLARMPLLAARNSSASDQPRTATGLRRFPLRAG